MSADTMVSVVLPCFNAERTVGAALDSLLGQTHRALEIIALDDGSTDATSRVLADRAARDDRILIVRNPSNLGLIATLNRGITEARGPLIARMDADDVALPERVARQVRAIEARPDVAVVGTAVRTVDLEGRPGRPRPVRCVEPGAARFLSLFGPPIVHPTLLARAEVLRAHPYASATSLHTEDYELFARMISAGVSFMNLVEPLVVVRASPHGMSLTHEAVQVENFVTCARRHLERMLGMRPKAGVHRVLVNRMTPSTTARDLVEGLAVLDAVEAAFLSAEPATALEVRGIAAEQRVDILVQAMLRGGPTARLAAPLLALRNGRTVLSPRARRYAAGKLRPSVLTRAPAPARTDGPDPRHHRSRRATDP